MPLFVMNKCIIYALIDPDTGIIRYIGKTTRRPWDRYKVHLQPCELRSKTHKIDWIKSILAKGKKPGMEILVEVDVENGNIAEIAYIAACGMMGFDLVNGTDGGDGLQNPSKETRCKMGIASRSWVRSSMHRQALSRALKGNTNCKGNITSDETKRKQSKSHRDIPHPYCQGEKHRDAKMTKAGVIEARRLYAAGKWTYKALGVRYGVSKSAMQHMITRRTWRYV